MGFLSPYMFWGLLALSVPLLIHLWNGRKGQKVYWAAFRFLEENDNKPIRHIRLEQWFLMLLRMVFISLFVLVMVQVFFDFLENEKEVMTVHLVEPNPELLSEFRFELNQAIENGDQVILLNPDLEVIGSESLNETSGNQKMNMYKAIQKYSGYELKLYLTGFASSFDLPKYLVESDPEIFIGQHVTYHGGRNAIEISPEEVVKINDEDQMVAVSNNLSSLRKVSNGNFKVSIQLNQADREKEVLSSLKAIEEVFGLKFEIKEEGEVDMVFTDNLQEIKDELLIFDFSGDWINAQYPNVYFIKVDQERRLSAKQQLPSEILNSILHFYGIEGYPIRLDQEEIQQKFIVKDQQSSSQQSQKANAQEIIWVILLLVLIAERIVANKAGL